MEIHVSSSKDLDVSMVLVLTAKTVIQVITKEMEDVIAKYLIVKVIQKLAIVLNVN